MSEKIKKPFYKRWYVWVIAVFLVFVAIGSSGSDTTADSSLVTDQSGDTTQETTTQEETTFKIGDKIQLKDGTVLTVNTLERTAGQDYSYAEDGHEYVILNVTIENSGDSKVSYNPFYFEMQNSNGNITSQTYASFVNNTLSSGDLAAGGMVNGNLVWEQPIGDNGLKLMYDNYRSEVEIDLAQ